MKYHACIEINEGRIDYELKAFGAAVVGIPSDATEDEVSSALKVMRSKYDFVDLDADGDIIINA